MHRLFRRQSESRTHSASDSPTSSKTSSSARRNRRSDVAPAQRNGRGINDAVDNRDRTRGESSARSHQTEHKRNTSASGARRHSTKKARISGPFLVSGRQDLNLRPPGPQPGALPDCATPRGSSKRATGIEPALEAWKASVQPQHFARKLSRHRIDPREARWRARKPRDREQRRVVSTAVRGLRVAGPRRVGWRR